MLKDYVFKSTDMIGHDEIYKLVTVEKINPRIVISFISYLPDVGNNTKQKSAILGNNVEWFDFTQAGANENRFAMQTYVNVADNLWLHIRVYPTKEDEMSEMLKIVESLSFK